MILENHVIYNTHMFFTLAAFAQLTGLFAYGMGLLGANLYPRGQRRFCRRLWQSISLLMLVSGSAFMLFFAFTERDATLFLGQLAFLLASLLILRPRYMHTARHASGYISTPAPAASPAIGPVAPKAAGYAPGKASGHAVTGYVPGRVPAILSQTQKNA